jgi:hypothetical protein
LLRSQGKLKADDEPINVADLIPHLGHHEVMRGLFLFPEHEAASRKLAVSIARGCSHLVFDRKEVEGLDLVERYLDGAAGPEALELLRSEQFSPWIQTPVEQWQYLKAPALAVLAIASTAVADGTKAPFYTALATELALSRLLSLGGVGMELVDMDTGDSPETIAAKWKAVAERDRMISEGIPAPEDNAARKAAEARHEAMLREFLSEG